MGSVRFRHCLFDWGLLKSTRPSTPTICIGNITVGGSGKSPMCELLIRELEPHIRVAVLSRGYGRKSRGYIEVTPQNSYMEVGDEPLEIKRRHPSSVVVVCESRVEGIRRIEQEHPEVELVIMDDGFQHRYITPHCNIIMVDATRPTFEDLPLPAGSLRDTPKALARADIFVVSKCPEVMDQQTRERFSGELLSRADQQIYFSRIANATPRAIFEEDAEPFDPSAEVIALSGIANPKPLHEWIERYFKVVSRLTYADHHRYSTRDIESISTLLDEHPNAVIVTTEKDMVKFIDQKDLPAQIRKRE